MTELGILFSHASEITGDLVAPVFQNSDSAAAHAELVCQAQPGVEFELVARDAGGQWRSSAGETPREVIERRWS